jgi:hypothetical protein
MVVYYSEYIAYQIYPDIYGSLLYRIYSLPNALTKSSKNTFSCGNYLTFSCCPRWRIHTFGGYLPVGNIQPSQDTIIYSWVSLFLNHVKGFGSLGHLPSDGFSYGLQPISTVGLQIAWHAGVCPIWINAHFAIKRMKTLIIF